MNADTTSENSGNSEEVVQSTTREDNTSPLNDNQNDTSNTSQQGETINSDSSSEENHTTDNENDTATATEGEFRRQLGEKNALILKAYEDKPEKLLELLEKDSSLRKSAEKNKISVKSLKSQIAEISGKSENTNTEETQENEVSANQENSENTENQSQATESNPEALIPEAELLEVAQGMNAELSAEQMIAVQKKAEELKKALPGLSLSAITVASLEDLGFRKKESVGNSPVGDVGVGSGGGSAFSGSMDVYTWDSMSVPEKDAWEKKNGGYPF